MASARAYDYVIVGAGSAGCVLAARLTEDPGVRVLLLEAGPRDSGISLKMPAALGLPLGNTRYNWFYHTEPEPHLGNRRIYEARGRVLGGSSSINGMNWVRGNRRDYDGWAANGAPGWSYADCLPYFKRAETWEKGADAYRGGTGPMRIEASKPENPLYHAFLDAGVAAGHTLAADHNGAQQEGMHITQRNIDHGIRCSTSRAYLDPARGRPNLEIATGAQASEILIENGRARGIAYRRQGTGHSVECGEVIVSAGAINSPQLLMLSGIGDGDALRGVGIAARHHLPGVGRGLRDHIAAPIQYESTKPVSIAGQLGRFGRLKVAAEWLLFHSGLGASNFFEVGGFIRTGPQIDLANIQYEFIPVLGEFMHGAVELGNGFQYFLSLMRPTSEGRVSLASADPLASPRFVFNYLDTEVDRRQMIDAVHATRAIIQQRPWDPFRGREITPGPDVRSDDDILAWLRQTAGTNYHPCCTCRMGRDEMAVTDAEGRVRGVMGLRVIDASIMPEIVTANLNAPVIMMAEKLADSLRGRAVPSPVEN